MTPGFNIVTVERNTLAVNPIETSALGGNDAGGTVKNGYCYSVSPKSFVQNNESNTPGFKIVIEAKKAKVERDNSTHSSTENDMPEDCGVDPVGSEEKKNFTLQYVFKDGLFKPTKETENYLQEISRFLK